MAEALAQICASMEDPANIHQLRDSLISYEKQALGHRPLTPDALAEARAMLGLTGDQMGDLLGFKKSAHTRQKVSAMEHGRSPIKPYVSRLVRAYLSGYRPPDWPV